MDREYAERLATHVFRTARLVVTVSKDVAAYVRRMGVDSSRVLVLSNGVDPWRFIRTTLGVSDIASIASAAQPHGSWLEPERKIQLGMISEKSKVFHVFVGSLARKNPAPDRPPA